MIKDALPCTGGKAHRRRAQGQIDAVTAQEDGIFNGHSIVGLISAASGAKDLHHKQLCIGSNALHMHGLAGLHEPASLLDVTVGSGNTSDVGAVATLLIVFVGDIQVTIDVVVAEGDLGADIELVRCQSLVGNDFAFGIGISLVDVELRDDLRQLFLVQKMQRLQILASLLPV